MPKDDRARLAAAAALEDAVEVTENDAAEIEAAGAVEDVAVAEDEMEECSVDVDEERVGALNFVVVLAPNEALGPAGPFGGFKAEK